MAVNKRQIQEINAGSMADIAFLLLIFFLVATTMSTDRGIQRVLPAWVDNTQDVSIDVKGRNLLPVNVNMSDQILAGGELINIMQLKDKAKEFILNVYDDEHYPEKEAVEIDLIGTYMKSKGVVSLQAARGTSYKAYIAVQNELTKAFNEIRDAVSNQYFGKNFADLDENQRKAVTEAVPQQISEAEPKNVEIIAR